MKDAQKISSPIGVDKVPSSGIQSASGFDATQTKDRAGDVRKRSGAATPTETSNRLRTIHNALQCTVMALPNPLKYRHQSLSFGMRETDRHACLSKRLLHSSIYSIHIMIQLTKLMIYKYHIFPNLITHRTASQATNSEKSQSFSNHQQPLAEGQVLEQYSEASDAILSVVGKSHEEHYKYVNPFLANTIWLAGVVQLLYRELAPLESSNKELTNSNYELLSRTYNMFVSYWNMSPTMQKNLEIVESELENLQEEARDHDNDEPEVYKSERRPSARRHSSRRDTTSDRTAASTLNELRAGEPRDSGKAQEPISCGESQLRCSTGPNQTSGHNYPQDSRDAIAMHTSNWPAINGNHQYTDMQAQHESMNGRLYNESMAQQQHRGHYHQVSDSRASNNVGTFLSSGQVVTQMTPMSQNHPNTGLPRHDQSPHLFGATDGQSALSPDFFNGMSFSRDFVAPNASLSTYLGEMLSGSYIG